MIKDIFMPTDILLPDGVDLEKWSVIACDQFSSERDYWERVREKTGGGPSTLNMIIPEVYLGDFDEGSGAGSICAAMDACFELGLFREVQDSFIYVQRTLQGGQVRHGLVGAVDLERYDFSGGEAAILASEGTIQDRLPVRIGVRRAASLELPHIMAFINDKEAGVIEPLGENADSLPLLYDFDLMEGGGRIRGMRVHGKKADGVTSALRALGEKSRTLIVIGDGNHSLAAAKVFWDEIKQGMSEALRENHPARLALLEVNNIYDPAIEIEAIHRVFFGDGCDDFIKSLEKSLSSTEPGYEFTWVSGGESGVFSVSADCIGGALAGVQKFIDDHAGRAGCRVDYIHGAETVKRLARGVNCAGLIMPAIVKSELFATVTAGEVFPKKSFSVGRAADKRYYLECRGIRG